MRNSPDIKVSEEAGEGGAPGTGAGIAPLMVKAMEKQTGLLQLMKAPTLEQMDSPSGD